MTNKDRMAWLVLVVWTVTTLFALATERAEIAIGVTPIAMIVLGFYFGRSNGK